MALKNLYLLLPFILLLKACSGSGQTDGTIVYDELTEVDVQLLAEAGEGNDYYPGRIHHLFVSSNGDLLVGDMGSNTIEQFSPDGEHRATIATQGGGPGEVSGFFSLHDAGGDTLMLENQGGRRDLFYPNDSGIYTYIRNMTGDTGTYEGFTLIGVRSEIEFYATRRRVIRNPTEMMSNSNDYYDSYVLVVNRQYEVVSDSIQHLSAPEMHMHSVGDGFSIHTVPFRNHDRFVQVPGNGYLVARPASSEIEFFNEQHEQTGLITMSVADREVSDEDLDHTLQNASSEMRRDIEPRVYNIKPPFLNLWATEDLLWLQTDNSALGKQLVLMDYEGNFQGQFTISKFDEVQQVDANRIYTIHRNPDLGDSVRIYEIKI
ncbi:NHL repeat-containing protein [Rhodohalobacter halophilus]|uniref:hypothetical protein n=1 Tax=Rhodohalobacter halophilus TaxID=1812810 RepID=UPI00083F5343|nr:hypothetical protein [Rhodohalobacter halophilus]